MSLQIVVQSIQGNKRATKTLSLLPPTEKKSKLAKCSRIPVSSKSNIKSSLRNENTQNILSRREMSVGRQEFQSNENGTNGKLTGDIKSKGFVDREERSEKSEVFIWKTSVKPNEKKGEKFCGKMQIPCAIPADAKTRYAGEMVLRNGEISRKTMVVEVAGKNDKQNGDTIGAYSDVASSTEMGLSTEKLLKTFVIAKVDLDKSHVEEEKSEKRDGENVTPKIGTNRLQLFCDRFSDNATFSFEKDVGAICTDAQASTKSHSLKGERERKESRNSERNGTGAGAIPKLITKGSWVASDLRNEGKREESVNLRAQIDKLSSFVESSEDLRERSELLLTQQDEELEKQIHEKEVLKNKICCLEELRRNLQRKLDDQIEENTSLKDSVRNMESKLFDERENVKVVKKECYFEVSKNAELEVALQTVFEQLSSEKLKKTKIEGKDWDGIALLGSVGTGKRYTKYGHRSKYQANNEEIWNREKNQFAGKIKLLEMDKTKLRSHINYLEEKIVEHERIGFNLKENNDVLEFHIAELEYEMFELRVK